jgi:hypothetical protein
MPFAWLNAGTYPWPRWLPVVLLLVLVGLGGWLRSIHLSDHSLWQDEVFTVASATGNPVFEETLELTTDQAFDPATPVAPAYYRNKVQTLQASGHWYQAVLRNIQGPVYPWLTRQWMQLRDPAVVFHPVELRWLSFGFGLLGIAVAFLAGRVWLGPRFGLCCAGLVSFAAYQVLASQTARAYPLLILLAWASFWALGTLWKATQHNRPTSKVTILATVGLGMIHAIGVLCQYLFGLLTASQLAWMLWQAWRHPEARQFWLTRIGWVVLLVGLPMAGWWPSYQAQMAFLHQVGHGNLAGLWKPLSLVERLWSSLADQLFMDWAVFKVLATVLVLWGLWQLWSPRQVKPSLPENDLPSVQSSSNTQRALALLALCGVAGVLLGLIGLDLASQTHRILNKRYVILTSPGVTVLMALALQQLWQGVGGPSRVKQTMAGLLTGLVAVGMFWNTWGVVQDPDSTTKEGYAQAGQVLAQYGSLHDVLLVSHSGVHAVAMAYYVPDKSFAMLGLSRQALHQAVSTHQLDAYLRPRLRAVPQNAQTWLALTHLPASERTPLLAWFKSHATLVRYNKLPDMGLYCFKDLHL